MMLLGGQQVAAISPQPEQQREAGVPPMWNSYITVESADDALARAQELGAAAHAPAFDVMEAGRMAAVRDPQGAFVLLWEPRQHIGAAFVNGPGALCWNELASSDMDASAAFYGSLFGWSTEALPEGPMPYLVIKNADGHTNGGIRPVMPAGTPPHWLVYFGIDSADNGLAKVVELGGTQLVEPMDIAPEARIAVAQDPQGAVFALFSGHYDE
jgi:uncharacterized protein